NGARSSGRKGADDLSHTAGGGVQRQSKAMQLYDGRDEAQAQACALRIPALVGSVEAPHDDVTLVFADPRTGVANPNDVFASAADRGNVDASARRREFDRIVDQIDHRLEQK